jgi:hypothetical protein
MKKLAPILDLLDRAHKGLLVACADIPESRWTKAPAAGRWSAGENVAHLIMVEETVLAGARKALSQSPPRHPVWKRLHLPPVLARWRAVKRKSPIPLDRSLLGPREELLKKYTAARNRTLKLISETARRDLSRYRMPHPFFGSLNFYDWFRTLGYHEVRHTKQIREIGKSFHS